MAAAYQASGDITYASGANDVTPVLPTHAANDILICITCHRTPTANIASPPSGWTLAHGPVTTLGNWVGYIFWLRAASAGETNPLCDWTGTAADKFAQVHSVRGAITTGNPFAASAGVHDVTDPIVVTGITTTLANQKVIVVGLGSDDASATVTVSGTDPASYTQRYYVTDAVGNGVTGEFHDAVRTTAGATGNITLNHSSSFPAEVVFVAAMLEPVTGIVGPRPVVIPMGTGIAQI